MDKSFLFSWVAVLMVFCGVCVFVCVCVCFLLMDLTKEEGHSFIYHVLRCQPALEEGGERGDNPKASRSAGAGDKRGAKGLQEETGMLQGPGLPSFPSGPGVKSLESQY